MTQGVIWRQLVSFALPMMVGLFFQQLYNTVDTWVVGQYVGKEAQAAVGSSASIVNLTVGFCAGLSTGASVIISQRFGAHDKTGLEKAVHTSIVLTAILSVIVTFLGQLIISPMQGFMKTPENVIPVQREYMSIYFWGACGIMFYNMGSGILRAVGDSRRPLIFLIISACLNMGLDLLLVLVIPLGVAGVAYATILSQLISALLILNSLARERGPYGLRLKKLCFDMESFRKIIRLGLPSAIQTGVTGFSNAFVQSYTNALGDAAMAGYAVYGKLDNFVLVPLQAIGMASTTFVGQNWGARNPARAKRGVHMAMLMGNGSTLVLGTLVWVLARQLLGFFSPVEEVVSYGQRFIRFITPFYLFLGSNQIYSGALRGVGDATGPTVMMLLSYVAFRQLYLYTSVTVLGLGFPAVALGYPMGWVMCALLLTIRYRRSVLFRAEKTDAKS